ncbi:transposase [Methanobrevibacter sp.]|uniref:transposase n=1 Tax=Methanobrevibacter sp. TaxID=66852 RepID=UPI00386AFFD0
MCYTNNHRTITRYIHKVTYKVKRLMSSKDGIKDYKLRSKTVKAHNGTFKRIYNYDHIQIIGLKRVQNLIFTIVA